MLTAILVTTLATALAGDFADKMAYHGQAMAKVKTAVREVGDAQKSFQLILDQCEPAKVRTQEKLLDCAADFHAVHYQMRHSSQSLAEAKYFVAQLAPELAPAKEALQKLLSRTADLVAVITDMPQTLSAAYLQSNTVFILKQFQQVSQSAGRSKRIQLYCAGLQSEMSALAAQASFSISQQLSFAMLYRESIHIESTVAMAKVVAKPCNKQFDSKSLEQVGRELKAKLTEREFAKFRNQMCSKQKANLDFNGTACTELPMTAYSVHLLAGLGELK